MINSAKNLICGKDKIMNYRNRDIRVRENELVMWNPKTRNFDSILKNLPYSFGDYSVSNIAITVSDRKLLRVLLFRDETKDFRIKVYPVVCFYSPFKYEIPCCEYSFKYMLGGEENYKKIMKMSKINWSIAKTCYKKE